MKKRKKELTPKTNKRLKTTSAVLNGLIMRKEDKCKISKIGEEK